MAQDQKQNMDTRESFLRAITAEPDDLSLRLIFADWLDEQNSESDHAWAQVIRSEAEMEGRHHFEPHRWQLSTKADDLWKAHVSDWFPGFDNLVNRIDDRRRGFPDAITLSACHFLQRYERIFEQAPVRKVSLTHVRRYFKELADCPGLANVRTLNFGYPSKVTYAAVRLLAQSPFVENLEELNLHFNRIGPAGAIALAESPRFHQLQRLGLSSAYIGIRGIKALVEAPFFSQLTELDLGSNELEDRGLRVLTEVDLSQIRELDLGSNYLTDQSAQALRECDLPHLEYLRLSDNDFGVDGIAAFLNTSWNQLHELDFSWSHFGASELRQLSQWNALSRAHSLHLQGNDFSEGGLEEMLATVHEDHLTGLDLGDAKLNVGHVRQIADAPTLCGLLDLDLKANPIGLEGAKALADSPHFRNLRRLSLRDTQLGDEGIEAIVRSTNFPNLLVLILQQNRVGNAAVEAILKRNNLPPSSYLFLSENQVGKRNRQRLEKHFAGRCFFLY